MFVMITVPVNGSEEFIKPDSQAIRIHNFFMAKVSTPALRKSVNALLIFRNNFS